MLSLARRVLVASLAAVSVVLVLALGAGLVRLLPWLVAPEVPVEVAWPFARALIAVAVETAMLVGPPAGFALGAAIAVELGEVRALAALGVRPTVLARGTAHVALGLSAIAFVVSVLAGSGAEAPGRFANDLIEQGRASCDRSDGTRSARIPMVGMTWLCFSNARPRLVGTLPGSGGRAWFTATSLVASDDMRRFEIENLRLAVPRAGDVPGLSISAGQARVTGLSPWGRPKNLVAVGRASLVCLTGAALALVAVWWVCRRQRIGRAGAVGVALVSPIATFALLHQLDARVHGGAPYLGVPVFALAVWGLVLGAEVAIRRRSVARRRAG